MDYIIVIGQKVREFEIQSELGSGGYGVVYLAHDTSVNRDVAIKVILPQYANQTEFIANFEAEARLVAQLEHINIVPLYSYWHDETGAFLAMRYIRGGSLRGMIAKQGALPLNRILRIAEQIADALNVAHEAGVVHRDLKPDNILIDQRGNAYLTDFGIAKQMENDSAFSATDSVKGTFAYMSPEQMQQLPVSPQTDIYAFGFMLYEMLTGVHPFHNVSLALVVTKHLQEPIPDVCLLRDELPSAVNDVLQKATAKDARARYENTLDLIADLKNAISGYQTMPGIEPEPVVRHKPTTSEERNRHAMLQNVRSFWIEGVLDHALNDAILIDLGTTMESGAVENPWNTVLRMPTGEENISPDMSPDEIFDRMNGKLLILGDPGGGKTTMLLELARHLLLRADFDQEHAIPVVFNLSSWGEKQPSLETWLIDELSVRYHVPVKTAEKWVNEDALLLLLDGLDEVPEKYRDACVDAINTYRSVHGFVDLVVCSRIKDYENLSAKLRLNGAVVIQPLTNEQIDRYLDSFGSESQTLRELIQTDGQTRELARSPLMLSIMMLVYRGVSGRMITATYDIDSQRNYLFEAYVNRMLERRGRDSLYNADETRFYLHWLANKMQTHGQSLFHIEDLQPTWFDNPADTRNFPRLIRLISSIYMAIFWGITGLFFYIASGGSSALMVFCYFFSGIMYGYLFTHPIVLSDNNYNRWFVSALIGAGVGGSFGLGVSAVHGNPIAGLIVAVIYGFGIGFSAVPFHLHWVKRFRTQTDKIILLERVKYSNEAVSIIRMLTTVPITSTAGIVFSISLFPDQVNLTLLPIILAVIAGLVPSLAFTVYMDGIVPGDVGLRLSPNEGLKATINNMFRFALITIPVMVFWFIGMLILGVDATSAFLIWIATSFFHGSDTILSHGGIPLIQHLYLRFRLVTAKRIPNNYVGFLDYASSLILLRKVGGGYIFIHRYLLEYFARLNVNDSSDSSRM